MENLRINADRLLSDLDELAKIGAITGGGVSRPAMSSTDVAARNWFRARVEAAGLTFRRDGAGNLSAVLLATDNPAARTLLAGSHLDTVVDGGRFDGAVGVLAALEALRTIREAGLKLAVHLEAISFTDEEGEVLGLMGSKALTGQLAPEALARPRGGRDKLENGMRRLGITRNSILAARRDRDDLVAFLELHIEQGTGLEEAGHDIGIVTDIVGIRSYWLHFIGEAAHAGTTPIIERADALNGASAFVVWGRALVEERFLPGVLNCGAIEVAPGAFNIVPGEARLALEFRHITEPLLDEMADALFELARDVADDNGLTLQIEQVGGCVQPAPLDENIAATIERAADGLGLKHTRMVSYAGHDTQVMSKLVPSAMFFVPSVGGVSHNPREFTKPEDVVNGANVLLQAMLAIAQDAERS